MAKIKNTVDINVTEKGSKKAASNINEVTKAQTRQTSAGVSAGKQFAAQSQGLGGFVAAYAGAAANVFALQQAFAALQRAVQFETVIQGTKALAAEIGQSGGQILKSVKEITDSQLSLEETAQNVNIALSAGFNTEQIEKLNTIAFKAARTLGRNLTDSVQRVTRGVVKLEPELLDELGLFTRLDPAVEAYAAKLNVATSSLTNFEKRQAFLNALIEEGDQKFANIDTSIGGNQATLEKFVVQLTELATAFGQVVANVLSPFISFLSEGNRALVIFGGILALVFGKAASLVGASIGRMVQNVGGFADRLADMSKISKESLKDVEKSFKTARAAEGSIGSKGFNPRIAGQDTEQQAVLQETLKKQKEGNLRSTSALTKANVVYAAALKRLEAAQQQGSKRHVFLTALMKQNEKALDGVTASANLAAKASIGLSKAVNFLSLAFGKLQAFLGIIFLVISTLQLFGVDIIGNITNFFKDLSRETELLNAGMKGLAIAGAGGAVGLEKARQAANISKEEFKNFGKEVENAAEGIDDLVKKTMESRDKKLFGFRGARDERLFDATETPLETFGPPAEKATIAVAKLRAEIDKTDDAVKKLALESLLKGFQDFGNAAFLLGKGAELAEISAERAGVAFSALNKETGDVSRLFNVLFRGLEEGTPEFDKNLRAATRFGNVLDLVQQGLKGGRMTSEKLSKQLGGLRANFDILSESGNKSEQEINKLSAAIERLDERLRAIKTSEAIIKGLRDNFGGALKAADNAIFSGLIGGTLSGNDASGANQADFIKNTIERGVAAQKRLADLTDDEAEEATELNKQIEAGNVARKVAVGLSLELPAILKKQRNEQAKIQSELINRIRLINEQNELQKANLALETLRTKQDVGNKIQEARITLLEKEKELQETLLDTSKKRAAMEREMIKLQADANAQNAKLAEINRRTDAIRRERIARGEMAETQRDRQNQEAFSGLFTRSQVDASRLKLIEQEFNLQMAAIEEKARVAREDAEGQREALRTRILILMKEREDLDKQLIERQKIQAKEIQIEDAKNALETTKIEQESARLQAQKAIINAQQNVALTQLDSQAAARKFQESLQDQDIENLRKQVEIVNRLNDTFIPKFAEIVDKMIKALDPTATGLDLEKFKGSSISDQFALFEQDVATNRGMADAAEKAQRDAILGRGDAQRANINTRIRGQQDLLKITQERQDLEKQIADAKRAAAIEELEDQIEIRNKKIEGGFAEFNIIDATLQQKLEGLRLEADEAARTAETKKRNIANERNAFANFGSEVSKVFSGELTNSFKSFYQSIAEGNSILDSAKGAFQSFLGNIIEGLQEKLTDKFITPVLEDLTSSIAGSIFGSLSAAGGPVQLAGGGAMRRDRVPAMLEPGEFVIRKPMARAIGGPALSAMNGHGKGLGMPQIDVQINNSGAPKDAEAQVKPQMDVNKMVVEIVTRDLKNNGPIRKTLRGDQ